MKWRISSSRTWEGKISLQDYICLIKFSYVIENYPQERERKIICGSWPRDLVLSATTFTANLLYSCRIPAILDRINKAKHPFRKLAGNCNNFRYRISFIGRTIQQSRGAEARKWQVQIHCGSSWCGNWAKKSTSKYFRIRRWTFLVHNRCALQHQSLREVWNASKRLL